MPRTPKGLSDEKAARIMTALRAGETPRKFAVKAWRLEAYLQAHPEYAAEARPLIETNAVAAQLRKGAKKRALPSCKYGHPLSGANLYLRSNSTRRCLTCQHRRERHGKPANDIQIKHVTAALNAGKTITEICWGRVPGKPTLKRLVGFRNLRAYRELNPKFDDFVLSATVRSNSKAQQRRHDPGRARIATRRDEANDFYKITDMVPAGFPSHVRDDIAQSIMLALLEGSLQRDQVRDRVQQFVGEHNRLFPTKYAKFGDSPLVSLDEVMFDGGTATRGDTVSRGLWD
jgi:hypothetical protein